jgi:hypothetical protein
MSVVLLDPCSTFVPDAYRWLWIRRPGEAEALDDDALYERQRVCHRCERPPEEHRRTIVEIYTATGPFMMSPSTIEELR